MGSSVTTPSSGLESGLRVTVFGGSGFVGRHLIRRLAQAGAHVRVGVRDVDAALFLKPFGEVGQIVPLQVDVSDTDQVLSAVQNADVVVNLVGILYERGSRTFQRIHVDCAANVAKAAAIAGAKRFLHVSALGADENSSALYSRTKKAGEEAVKTLFPEATIFRPSVIFGPEDDFFNKFAGMTQILPVLPVMGAPLLPTINLNGETLFDIDWLGDGGCKFQPAYVGNVAEAMHEVICKRNTAGEIFSLGGPKIYSFKELMQLVLQVTDRNRLLIPMPTAIASFQALFLQLLPKPILTPDQVSLMEVDNIVPDGEQGFEALNIQPTPAEAILPTYLDRFRRTPRV